MNDDELKRAMYGKEADSDQGEIASIPQSKFSPAPSRMERAHNQLAGRVAVLEKKLERQAFEIKTLKGLVNRVIGSGKKAASETDRLWDRLEGKVDRHGDDY